MPPVPYTFTAENAKLKILLYGEPGAGKTTWASSGNNHPLLGPALFLNLEGGMMSVASRGIATLDVRSIDVLEEVYAALYFKDSLYSEYQTIVIDSGSEMYTQAITEVVRKNRELGIGIGSKQERTQDDFNVEDYGTAGNKIFRVFRGFRSLDRHVIVTAHPRVKFPQGVKDTYGLTPLEVGPSFSGQLGNKLVGLFDCVWYMYKKDGDFNILTDQHGPYKAKTRGEFFSAALGLLVQNKSLADIYEIMLRSENPTLRSTLVQPASVEIDMPVPIPPDDSASAAEAVASVAEAAVTA